MKIKEKGFIVTGLPVAESISVEPDGESFRIVARGVSFTPEQWRRFADAVVYARDRVDLLVYAMSKPEPADSAEEADPDAPWERWERIEDVPADVTCVQDRDGDVHTRKYGFWPMLSGSMNNYAPFKRAW